jgi:hypothetical protein
MDPFGSNAEPGPAHLTISHVGENEVLISLDDYNLILAWLPGMDSNHGSRYDAFVGGL